MEATGRPSTPAASSSSPAGSRGASATGMTRAKTRARRAAGAPLTTNYAGSPAGGGGHSPLPLTLPQVERRPPTAAPHRGTSRAAGPDPARIAALADL